MTKHIEPVLMLLASALLVGSLVTGCKDITYPDPQPASAAPNTSAQVRFVNASPDAPTLNFLIENNPTGQSLAFGQSSAAYLPLLTGAVQLRARAASGTIGGVIGSDDIVYRTGTTNQTNFAATAGGAYTVFVTDSINRPKPVIVSGTNPGGPQLTIVADPLTQTLTAGAGGVRFFHFVPDVGLPANSTLTTPSVVTVRLSMPTSATGVPTAIASFVNRAYRNVATTAFTSVPAGTYQVDLFSGATLPTSATTTAIASSTLTVSTSKLYTLYAQGLARRRNVSIGRIQHN